MAIASGVRFNQYIILSQLGSGGMGEIYLAQDTKLGRRVALKLLPEQFTCDAERVHRFEQEARAASALNHPNIITIHEIGQAPTERGVTHFIAAEFVEGQTINQRLSLGRMKLVDALDIAIQVANALTAAHAAGIIHRDIKPENLMLRPDGYIKVLDFGLAKLTEKFDSDESVDPEASTKPLHDTSPGVIMGTISYMSPEQTRGHRVDSRSDIFSLGVVIYEMVTGHKPFTGGSMSDVMAAILEKEPPPVAKYLSHAPAELQWVLSKTLAKDREARYQTIRELLNDLKRLKQQIEFRAEQSRSAQTEPLGESSSNRFSRNSLAGQPSYDTEVIESHSTSGAQALTVKVKRHKILAFMALLVIGAAAAGAWYSLARPKQHFVNSIAVLPLARSDADAATDAMVDGVTQAVIQNLSRVPKLKVRSLISVLRYKVVGSAPLPDPREVGKELQVPVILTGRVTRQADRFLINVELVDTKDNSYIWGQRYDRKPSELLALQEEITREVSTRLQLDLNAAEQAEREAYQFYLRGRFYWNRRTAADLRQGVDSFEQAIRRVPTYAPAYAGLADSYNMLGTYGAISSAEAAIKSREAAERAVQLDDSLAEGHNSLAFVKHRYDWDFVGAEKEFRRAIELDPNYAPARQWFSSFLISMGRTSEGLEEVRRCQELAPLSMIGNSHMALMLYYARRYEQALEQSQKILAIDQEFFAAHRYAGLAYEQLREYKEAIESLGKARKLSGDSPIMLTALAHAYAVSGDPEAARAVLDGLNANTAKRKVPSFDLAIAYVGLGEKEKAFALLEQALEEHNEYLIYLQVEPRFDPIRKDPRFAQLVNRIGLTIPTA